MAERGRPLTYTPEIGAEICRRISLGESLRAVCRTEGMPDESTVRRWALDDVQGFSPQYTRACEIRYLALADDLLEISDDGTNDWMERNAPDDQGWQINGEAIARSRLRVDTRKWILCKMLPKVFGDRASVEMSVSPGDKFIEVMKALSGPVAKSVDTKSE